MKAHILTEQEFIERWGINWRMKGTSFPGDMDYLFGTEIDFPNDFSQICKDDFRISFHQIKVDDIPENKEYIEKFNTLSSVFSKVNKPSLQYFYDNLYIVVKGNYYNICIFKNPTDNCQICSVLDFDSLLQRGNDIVKEEIKYLNDMDILKNILLFDVHSKYVGLLNIDKWNGIIQLNKYTSTNGSKMALGLLNVKEFTKKVN